MRIIRGVKLSDKITINKKELDVGMALVNQYAEKFDVSKYKDEYPCQVA